MANQATNADSGLKNRRVEFVREASKGTAPTDPAWNAFSDTLETALIASSDAQIEEQRGMGDVGVNGFFAGPEEHSASIDYHLQKWFTDGSGNPKDAAGDALLRDADKDVANTHTVVDRSDHGDVRTYTVAKGCHPNIGEVSGDPGSGLPIVLSLEYEAKKIRTYKVAQPAGEALTVSSTDAADTSQTLTIESDTAATTEDVTLNGTTSVTTTATFDSIDALELSGEAVGDIIVEDSGGDELARIHGSNFYDGIEGDLGVPTLGAGSHAGEVGSTYETFLDDTVTRGGAELSAEVRSASFSVSNGFEKAPVAGTKQQAVHTGQQETELSATVAGNFEGHSSMEEHLSAQTLDITWTMTGGSLVFKGAALTDLGDVGPESGEVISTQENTFTASDIQVN